MQSETASSTVTPAQQNPDSAEVHASELKQQSRGFDPFSQPFQIGAWEVDPKLNQLKQIRGANTRHLEPRLAKLLCYLAAHQLQLVDRDTLVAVLWPRVIVNENSLTRAVSELRKLLQLDAESGRVYIETIPKRGYRLCVPIQPSQPQEEASHGTRQWQIPLRISQVRDSAVAALFLAVTLGLWLQYETRGSFEQPGVPAFFDELVYTPATEQLRDEIVLSTSDSEELDAENSTDPVLAQDEERFAYIQYDHTGSTIYLGEVNGEYEPVPIFNSSEILFNLAWSPLEDALLFAGKPALTTTALFDRQLAEQARLYSFNLESFRLSLLVEEAPGTRAASEAELSLT